MIDTVEHEHGGAAGMSALDCGISEKDGVQGLMPKRQREKDHGYSNNTTSNPEIQAHEHTTTSSIAHRARRC